MLFTFLTESWLLIVDVHGHKSIELIGWVIWLEIVSKKRACAQALRQFNGAVCSKLGQLGASVQWELAIKGSHGDKMFTVQ
ncbi:hypothetical protein DUNSADRAFT_1773 [Dunaliella salina]|uniref:Encoded protein n=1 Tax=Dunaliella salina TaxID=3046 RepID=A0ABQ7FX82_DUNSA|nr:hypothetical protein DUNSADRAFT_1773 [Dunaliella salina]|eukprot:KAF5826902.1 hypothetical protein DUNSADRAFT_1773 [Dunaliella salina]